MVMNSVNDGSQGDNTMTIKDAIHAEFTPCPSRLAYYPTDSKSIYSMRWSKLFTPSAAAKKWDGAHASTTHCSWSDVAECYVYITIKVTGRQQTQIPGTDTWGTRVQITFNASTEDTSTAAGWVIAS